MPFDIRTYRAEEIPADVLEAVAQLTADAYERDLFTYATGDHPSTTPAAVHERLLRAFRRTSPGQRISVVWAIGRDGERIAVATARISHSERHVPLVEAIGDTTSPLPTQSTWCGFRYPTLPGMFAPTLPEAAVGEFAQFASANLPWLEPYVARGIITAAEAEAATRGAAFAVIADLYERDQERPPRAYIFDTRALQVNVLKKRFGLHILPLFEDGAGLRPEIIADPLHARTHQRWLNALAGHAPPDVIARGLHATIQHLSRAGFTGWSRIPMRLPWLMLNDDQTAAGMRRLAGVLPSAVAEPQLLAVAD